MDGAPKNAGDSQPPFTRVRMLLKHEPGVLATILAHTNQKNLTHIESRPGPSASEFFIVFDFVGTDDDLLKSLSELSVVSNLVSWTIPWFPIHISDLDKFNNETMEYSDDLAIDHPGFTDPVYRKRRTDIVKLAKEYSYGDTIPTVEYTDVENQTWETVYTTLRSLTASHACSEYLEAVTSLEEAGIFSKDAIPQLEDVSNFLKERTGFTLRPVQGLLSARDFLNGLAHRVFHATQYIRHHSSALYTPEPDVVHELLGHVPLFSNPDFADFSQQIGLASLGATDEDITRLATCYWFTVEFGLCRQDGSLRAYGAGLLSSFGELEYCLTDKPEVKPFDPMSTAKQDYDTTRYQVVYFAADSFKDATEKMTKFASTLDRPFVVSYNKKTSTVQLSIRPDFDSDFTKSKPRKGEIQLANKAWC